MLNRMFIISKTANRFHVAATASLIVGLITFLSPNITIITATVFAIIAVWMKTPLSFFLRLLLIAGVVAFSIFALPNFIGVIALAFIGFGIVGVTALVGRFVRAEIIEARGIREAEKAEQEENEPEEEQANK